MFGQKNQKRQKNPKNLKINKKKLLLIGCLCSFSVPLLAKEGVYLGGFYESIFTDSKKKEEARYDYIDKGKGPGLELSFLFSPSWGARVEWAKQDYTHTSNLAKGGSDHRLGLDLMYRFTEENHLYTFAGFKGITPADGHSVVNLGLGASLPFASRWSLFAEGAVYQGMSNSFTDFGIKGGLRYRFYTSQVSFIEPYKPVQTLVISQPKSPRVEKIEVEETALPAAIEQVLLSVRVNVLFPNDSSYIDPIYYPEIKKIADFMQQYPEAAVEIGGHTSAPASAQYNLRLSTARAKAVTDVLINEYDLDPNLITAKGYGKSRLLDLEDNEKAHAKNRRIEAIIYALEAKPLLEQEGKEYVSQ